MCCGESSADMMKCFGGVINSALVTACGAVGITGGVAFNRNGFYWNFYYGDEFIFAIAHPRMLQLIREPRLEITLELELAPLSLTAGVIR